MSENYATFSDLHLNREGTYEFEVDEFVAEYADQALDGIAYLGDAVSRPDLHDDLEDSDRAWAEYLREYVDFANKLNEAAERLEVDVYWGNGNHDPDPAAHPTRDAIETMQGFHEDISRNILSPEPEDNEDEDGQVDRFQEVDGIFHSEEGEEFNYDKNDNWKDLLTLDFLDVEEGEVGIFGFGGNDYGDIKDTREDTTIREYIVQHFDNLIDAEFNYFERDDGADLVFGSSHLEPEFNEDAEQTGDLYEESEFEEIAREFQTEPWYEGIQRKGGLFGMVGETVEQASQSVSEIGSYLSEARDFVFGTPEENETSESNDREENETGENEEWELSEDFTFREIPLDKASDEHRRYENKRRAVMSLVNRTEGPAIAFDHGMPMLSETDSNLDKPGDEHQGSVVWKQALMENSNIRSFVGGHFHNKGQDRVMYVDDDGRASEHNVVNGAQVHANLGFNDEAGLKSYEWFRTDGEKSTQVLTEPAKTGDLWEEVEFGKRSVVSRMGDIGRDLIDSWESKYRSEEIEASEVEDKIDDILSG